MNQLMFKDKGSITFNDEGSRFMMKTPRKYRGQPQLDWDHRMKARAHVGYLQANKLINVENDKVWGKKTYKGQDWYYHTYQGNTMLVTVRSADRQVKLSHQNNASLESFLKDTPAANVIFDIHYIDDGTDYVSTCQMSAMAVGLTSVGLVIAAVGFFAVAAFGGFAIEGAAAAFIAEAIGMELNVVIPGAGIILCVLAFIGIWLAFELGRNIEVNVIFENRSNQDLKIVDYSFYNIAEDHIPDATKKIYAAIKSGGLPMRKLREIPPPEPDLPPLDEYDTFDTQVVNYSKYKGIGLAFKFLDSNNKPITIAIRNDIYKDGYYRVTVDGESAADAYNNADSNYAGPFEFTWSGGTLKFTLDKVKFHNYNFAGIISFH